MRRGTIVAVVVAVAAGAIWLGVLRWGSARERDGVPEYGVIAIHPGPSIAADATGLRWERVLAPVIDEHHQSNKGDWIDIPDGWTTHPLTAFKDIPLDVRTALERHDCVVPLQRDEGPTDTRHNVVWGEFERSGQRDLVVLCAHRDGTSASYIAWNGEASRLSIAPWYASSLRALTRADVTRRLDTTKPLEPGTPDHAEHDAITAACCDCCSTIYYRHDGAWLTLPGSD